MHSCTVLEPPVLEQRKSQSQAQQVHHVGVHLRAIDEEGRTQEFPES